MSKNSSAVTRDLNASQVPRVLDYRSRAPRDTDVLERRVAEAEAAITPRNAKAYGPHQRRYKPCLNDRHHFGTVAALRERQEGLSKFTVPPAMRVAQAMWGATYTQAFYTRPGNAEDARTLLEQLDLLVAAMNNVADELTASMDAVHAPNAVRLGKPTTAKKRKSKKGTH